VTLLEVHQAWAWAAVIGNGVAGAWALAAHWVPALRRRALWWFTGAAQLAMAVQVVLGVALITVEDLQAPDFHLFYGFLTLIAVGLIYSYKAQVAQLHLLYGLGGLFIMGLGIRAMLLG